MATNKLQRSVTLERDGTNIRISVSSDAPVRQWLWVGRVHAEGDVILSHSADAIVMDYIADGIPLLDGHGGELVARTGTPIIADGKLYAESITWSASERAQVIASDVERGVIRSLSIEADYADDAVVNNGDGSYTVTRWTPIAAAFVAVPADVNVGIGREHADPQSSEAGEAPTSTEQEPPAVTTAERQKPMADNTATPPLATAEIGMAEADINRYSIARVIRHLAGDTSVDITLEREASDECARRMHRSPQGMYIPHDVLSRSFSTADASGGGLVPTRHLGGSFIELLRSRMVLDKLGVTILDGLDGHVSIPRQTASATAYWVSEGGDVTTSNPVIGNVTLTPHTIGSVTDITRQLLKQSDPIADQVVINDLTRVLAHGIQTAVFGGTGTSGQPTGLATLLADRKIDIATAGSPTYAELVAGEGEVLAYEGLDDLHWAVSNYAFSNLRGIQRNTYSDRYLATIYDSQAYVMDSTAAVTSDIADANGYFGDFSGVILGMWGGLDLNVDPYSLSKSGGLRIVALQDVDVQVRQLNALIMTDEFKAS